MSDQTYLITLLSAMNVIQLGLWGFLVQRLVDKLMSRTYYDYKVAENIGKKPVAKLDDSPDEDFRSLNEIMSF